jgi:hypothetical protein
MPNESLDQQIQKSAENYSEKNLDELERMLAKTLRDTAPYNPKYPTRRGSDLEYWTGVRKRIVRKIVQNKDVASITTGMVATQVLEWARVAGVDLSKFHVAIALLVAIITKSAIEELKARESKR